jgi:hypothetical protein
MNYIEQLHLDAINNAKFKASYSPIPQISESIAVSRSAEITKQISIEFAKWADRLALTSICESDFEEFLKSKQPNDGIQTN